MKLMSLKSVDRGCPLRKTVLTRKPRECHLRPCVLVMICVMRNVRHVILLLARPEFRCSEVMALTARVYRTVPGHDRWTDVTTGLGLPLSRPFRRTCMNRQCKRATNWLMPMSRRLSEMLQARLTTASTRRTMLATPHALDRLLPVKLVPIRRNVNVMVLSLGRILPRRWPSLPISCEVRVHLDVHSDRILVRSGHVTPMRCRVSRIVLATRLVSVTISAGRDLVRLVSLAVATVLAIS